MNDAPRHPRRATAGAHRPDAEPPGRWYDRLALRRLDGLWIGTFRTAVVAAIALPVACASSRNLEPPSAGQMLSTEEQQAVLAAMRETVPDDFEPVPRRTEARQTEWRDVPGVIAATAALHEMAIVAREIRPGRMIFALRTLDDRPAYVDATHAPDGTIRFAASVGRFDDDSALSASLVATADAFMAGGVRRVTVAEMLADPQFGSGGAQSTGPRSSGTEPRGE